MGNERRSTQKTGKRGAWHRNLAIYTFTNHWSIGNCRALGPVVDRLESIDVLFSPPALYESLPVLPGRVVKQVRTTTSPRGFAKNSPPVMVGEFRDSAGADYAMIVNLSLERSIYFDLDTMKEYRQIQVFSPVEAKLSPLGNRDGHWLTPGQGELIKFE